MGTSLMVKAPAGTWVIRISRPSCRTSIRLWPVAMPLKLTPEASVWRSACSGKSCAPRNVPTENSEPAGEIWPAWNVERTLGTACCA